MAWTVFGKKEELKEGENMETNNVSVEELDEDNINEREMKLPELPPLIPNRAPEITISPNLAVLKKEEPIEEFKPKNQTLFVKIEKFKEAKSKTNAIEEGVIKIEKIINSINEIKEKEEAELSYCEEEMKKIRSYLEVIDKNLFNESEF